MKLRLASSERRQSIVDAAVPLFARKGFAGTTTREIAEAAGVSEALVFKYFASKTALYEAILVSCDTVDPAFAALQRQGPCGTAGLVAMVELFAERFSDTQDTYDPNKSRHRLFLRSLLEDGEFARTGLRTLSEAMLAIFIANFEDARRAGDLIPEAPTANVAFWFMVQNAVILGSLALSGTDACMAGFGNSDMVRGVLRGIGLREGAVAAHCSHGDVARRAEARAAML